MGHHALRRRYGRAFSAPEVRRIARMVQRNDHTRAYIAGAKLLGADALAEQFREIDRTQEAEGFLPHALGEHRYALYQEMMALAKQQLTPAEYAQFYRAF
jgi:hypothetical protein